MDSGVMRYVDFEFDIPNEVHTRDYSVPLYIML